MGMDLLGKHGDERFSASAWRECLERASEFGWQPEGTLTPTDWHGEWNGSYFSNDWQAVTDRDARTLGEALLRAIATLSSRANVRNPGTQDLNALFVEVDPSHAEIGCLRRLADYALKGGFIA